MAHFRPDCGGYVASLHAQAILCTGKTYVDGIWLKRPALHEEIRRRGGHIVEGTRNANVTLLVIGDLPNAVADPLNHRSQNLVYAEEQRTRGNHVCLVDDDGISALLRGQGAPCLRSRALGAGIVQLSLPVRGQPPRPQLRPLKLSIAPVRGATGLELDLSGLDQGTAAHQETLQLLTAALSPTAPLTLDTPKVDAAWHSRTQPRTLIIAEVKSLTGAHQAQQIRLGIGQVIDYAVSLRANPPEGVDAICPTLVLEKKPDEARRWETVAAATGIVVTWAPAFTGLPLDI